MVTKIVVTVLRMRLINSVRLSAMQLFGKKLVTILIAVFRESIGRFLPSSGASVRHTCGQPKEGF